MDIFNWGILGPGRIARQFARDLQRLPDARRLAVGSRSMTRATAFADAFGFERAYDSYEQLVADPEVQAIYVATPHPLHLETARLCLEQGKAVLCEKPLTATWRQAQELVDVARRHDAFLMEAMWTRFIPVIAQVREWLTGGRIGEPRLVTADFGFRAEVDPAGRLFSPALAGGSLLDVGVYVVSLAQMVFGAAPVDVKATGHVGETGVDEQVALALCFQGGGLASLSCAIRTQTSQLAIIDGTEGRITIPNFWHATEATMETRSGVQIVTQGEPGYQYEAAEVMSCVRQGRLESDAMPLSQSLDTLACLDAARQQVGVTYPFEEQP